MKEFNTEEEAIIWLKGQNHPNIRNIYVVFEDKLKEDETYKRIAFSGKKQDEYYGTSEYHIILEGKPARLLCNWS